MTGRASSSAVLDHVAVAVPTLDTGRAVWRDDYGGGLVGRTTQADLVTEQYRYPGDGRIELIAPAPASAGGPIARFLSRFGEAVHHITVKVPDLDAAIGALRAADIPVTGVDRSGPHWHEAFISPRVTGLTAIQVAWTDQTLAEAAARQGVVPTDPRADAGQVIGAWFRHPDPAAHMAMWAALGAKPTTHGESVVCQWPTGPLRVWITAAPGPARVLTVGMADTARPVTVCHQLADQIGPGGGTDHLAELPHVMRKILG